MLSLVFVVFTLLAPVFAQQERNFTPVEGATFRARQEQAARRAASAGHARFWTAYSFDVRPGLLVDFQFVSDDGRVTVMNGAVDAASFDSFTLDSRYETRNLGVFVLNGEGGRIERLEVFNLERAREYAGHPVYWLGRAANEESLGYLRNLALTGGSDDVAPSATRAVSYHDDPNVAAVLAELARSSPHTGARVHAVRSLGRPPLSAAVREFLVSTARDESEHREVRRAAVMSFGRSRDAQALSGLQSLYAALASRELRRSVLSSVARNENRTAAADFLSRVASRDDDRELRRAALAQLGQMAGERALGALANVASRADADTEIQKQALAAIAHRPAAESVPLLIKYAETHPKPELRKQALILLGRTGDHSAIAFLVDFIKK